MIKINEKTRMHLHIPLGLSSVASNILFTPMLVFFRDNVCEVSLRPEVAEGESGLQYTCTALSEDGEAESYPQHEEENTPERNYLSGEAIDNENNACYLNQGESMAEAGIMREMSAQPLLELTPMTGKVNGYIIFTIINYCMLFI